MKLSEASQHLRDAIRACADAERINIKGKQYAQVATRVAIFRQHFLAEGRIVFEDREITPEVVRMRAVVEVAIDSEGDLACWTAIAEGQAEEYRDASQVNRTSAVENCETSAMGRALAQLGLLGGEYASANEVQHAIASKVGPEQAAADIGAGREKLYVSESYEQFREVWHGLAAHVREAISKDAEFVGGIRARLKAEGAA